MNTLSLAEKGKLVRDLAIRHDNTILMTGEYDVLSDGRTTYAVNNGHEMLGRITGSGCTLGTAISTMLAVVSNEKALLATLAATVTFGLAAENAILRDDVKGPGTFLPAFIDELYHIQQNAQNGHLDWTNSIKLQVLGVDSDQDPKIHTSFCQ